MFDSPQPNGQQHGGAPRFGNDNDIWSKQPSEESAAKIVRMGHLLSKKLGPEYLSTRQGPGGSKLTYLEGWRAISLANEVFGFNGWSSSVRDISIDFLDYSEETGRWNVHVTALVRVTLPDGCYHEDVGCGKMDNCKSKADALDKVKKEAVTDAMKRALRNFGSLMGNCIYDKNFLSDISKVKAPGKVPLDFSTLHRPGQEYDLDGKVISAGAKADAIKPPVAGPSNAVQQNGQNQQVQNVNKPQVTRAQQAPQQKIPPVQSKPQMPVQKTGQYAAPAQPRPNQQLQQPPHHVQQARPNPPQPVNRMHNHAPMQPQQQNHQAAVRQPQGDTSEGLINGQRTTFGNPNRTLDSEDMLYEGMEDESFMPCTGAQFDDSGFDEGDSNHQGQPDHVQTANNDNQPQSRNNASNAQHSNHQPQQFFQPQLPLQRQQQQQPVRPPQSAVNPLIQSNRPVAPAQNGQNRPQTHQTNQSALVKHEQQHDRPQFSQEKTHVRKISAENGQSKTVYRQQKPQEQAVENDPYAYAQTQPVGSGSGRSSGKHAKQAQGQGSSPLQRLQSHYPAGAHGVPEPVTFTSGSRGTKRPYDQFEQPQNPILQSAQDQGIKRAISPSERARQAEQQAQQQAQQQMIAQNRQAAIEKRQRLNAGSFGTKPVSA